MKKVFMTSSVLALILTTGLQTSAAKNDDREAAKCVAGAVVGGFIGGLFGNAASNGDAGATAAGAGLGALAGGSAACNQDGRGNVDVDVTIGDGRGDRWDDRRDNDRWDDNDFGRGGHSRWDDNDWRDNRGRGSFRVAPGLIEKTLRQAFYKRTPSRTTGQGRDGSTVSVQSFKESQSRFGRCISYTMELWSSRGFYSKQNGTACLSRNGDIVQR